MIIRITRRRIVAGLACSPLAAASRAQGAARFSESAGGRARRRDAAVALEFTPADLAYRRKQAAVALAARVRTLQPVLRRRSRPKSQARCAASPCAKATPSRPGQMLARIDTADLETKLVERIGALESARAQLALAEKTRTMNPAPEPVHLAERVRQHRVVHRWRRGTLKSAEAQMQLAQNALRDAAWSRSLSGIVAKRHVQPGEKVAFDAPLVTVVDLRDLELQAHGPRHRCSGAQAGHACRAQRRRLRRAPVRRPRRAHQSVDRARHARHLVYVGLPNPDAALRSGMFTAGRVALAGWRAVISLPRAVRSEAGQTFVWTIDEGKLASAIRLVGTPRREQWIDRDQDGAARESPVLAARFDNLKDGAPAIGQGARSSNAPRRPSTASAAHRGRAGADVT